MAQISYGTITVTDTTDITNIYFEYCLASEGATDEQVATLDYFFNFSLSTDTTCEEGKTYYVYRRIDETEDDYEYIPVINPTGNPYQQNYYEGELIDANTVPWSTAHPTWIPGYEVWIREVQTQEGIDLPIYQVPFLETTTNDISQQVESHTLNIEALQSKLKLIWINEQGGDEDYPTGTYAASGIVGLPLEPSNSQTYGYNSLLRHSAIDFRYNNVNLLSAGQEGIFLYHVPTVQFIHTQDSAVNPNKVYYTKSATGADYFPVESPTTAGLNSYYELSIVQGTKSVEISNDGLSLYTPTDSDNEAVKLSTNGLLIKNGSIILGENDSSITTGSIALTNYNFSRAINGINRQSLRMAIGNSFAVSQEGKLYAYGAIIEGDIIIGSNSNVYTKDQTYTQAQLDDKITEVNNNIPTMEEIATDNTIVGTIESKITEQTADFVLNSDADIQKWRTLSNGIEINSTAEQPYINIATGREGESLRSYLHLQGDSINFVVNNDPGALLIETDGIYTKDVHADIIYMSSKNGNSTLGWIVRDDGHLSLKIIESN